ncbi:16S rRNA (uracil(1498)-N(3))-methyltransferase [Altericista sp. CCNU0014]|uniref:16S rRNA (uracil(1498)-N(3))-methyltransferase n=1 Tax=Altericista sp. CCNU0014 TaxID=3082949 RepID=UPI0038509B51
MAQFQRLAIAPTQLNDRTIALTAQQQHYLTRVLRLKGGDRFIAICHQTWWLAQLDLCQPEAQLLESVSVQTELDRPIALLAALTKGQGFDEVVRAATEMGVAVLIPLLTARTIANPGEGKLERWRRIAAEAAEQSCRQIVPEVLAPVTFENALALAKSDRFAGWQRSICVTDRDGKNLWQALVRLPQLGILIMVGPEGGWTAEERAAAIAQGFAPVSLGRRVLRAVTASLAAVALLSTRIDAEECGKNIDI